MDMNTRTQQEHVSYLTRIVYNIHNATAVYSRQRRTLANPLKAQMQCQR